MARTKNTSRIDVELQINCSSLVRGVVEKLGDPLYVDCTDHTDDIFDVELGDLCDCVLLSELSVEEVDGLEKEARVYLDKLLELSCDECLGMASVRTANMHNEISVHGAHNLFSPDERKSLSLIQYVINASGLKGVLDEKVGVSPTVNLNVCNRDEFNGKHDVSDEHSFLSNSGISSLEEEEAPNSTIIYLVQLMYYSQCKG